MPFDPTYLDNLPGTADTPKSAVDKLNVNLLSIKNAIVALDVATTALQLLTVSEKAALAGTSGTAPSAANPFVDSADLRLLPQELPDATTSVKGVLKLGGQLTGTATAQKVTGLRIGSTDYTFDTVATGDMIVADGTVLKGVAAPTGYVIPTGVGFRHVAAGLEDEASKLVENADVAANAAIAESKINLAYGTSALNTAAGNAQSTATSALNIANAAQPAADVTTTPGASKIPKTTASANLDSWITTGLPAGTIIDYAGTSAPAGFLACDGSSVLRASYAALFSAIGTTWGSVDGDHFSVPDLRRKATVGSGGSGTATLGNTVGSAGGAETHTLQLTEMAAHDHGGATGSTQIASSAGGGSNLNSGSNSTLNSGDHTHTISSAGGGGAHNNIQPSAVVMKIIKT
jgi:microcystin-dependent protein